MNSNKAVGDAGKGQEEQYSINERVVQAFSQFASLCYHRIPCDPENVDSCLDAIINNLSSLCFCLFKLTKG